MDTPTNLGTFSVKNQTKTNRIELGEKTASVSYTPAGWVEGNPYLTLDLSAPFAMRRAALNACIRHFYQFDIIDGDIHWYDGLNPSREGGAKGWLRVAGLYKGNFKRPVSELLSIGGEQVFVTWPSKQMYQDTDGRIYEVKEPGLKPVFVTYVEQPWLQIVSMGGDIVQLKHGKIDEKTGKDSGVLLHNYLHSIHKGTKITVVVALAKKTNYETGEIFYDDRLQRKANHIERTILGENFKWETARVKAIEDKILFSSTMRVERELRSADPEYGKREDTLATLSDRKTGTTNSALRIVLDGKDVSVGDVKAGVYEMYVGTARKGQVDLAYAGGASRLNAAARQGWQLRTVKVYETK